MRALLLDLIPQLPHEASGCECADAIGPLSPYEIG
jgi:hypothetical protein